MTDTPKTVAAAGVAQTGTAVPAFRLNYDDPIPLAYADVDAKTSWLMECDALDVSAQTALERAEAQLDGAKLSAAQAAQTRADRQAMLAAASDHLAEVLAADPETADAISTMRSRSHDQEIAVLTARLAELKGGK